MIYKDLIQQPDFLKKYPTYDGRNVKIAILDMGLNVSLAGFQKTTTGLPKVIDYYDFTEDNRIDTSVITTCDSEGWITGLTGKRLEIPPNWTNPSKEWHIGKKYFSIDDDFADKKKLCPQQFSPQNFAENIKEADCIVWYDGASWNACLDTSFAGDLSKAKVLKSFREAQDFGRFLDYNDIPYCVNIESTGNSLDFNLCDYSHGTIVSQIAAAYCPENPEDDGIAPGAQIVFMNINQEHLPTMKAFKKCKELNVDLINCSFLLPIHREAVQLFSELSYKYGIMIVDTVGNDGPCLFNGLNKSLFTFKVGAYYSKTPSPYCPSNCGPASNDSLSVDFIAPGYVELPTPKEREKSTGSSISTPTVVGAIACMLSGLKAEKISYSPASIQKALMNTARMPDNGHQCSYGYGFIQMLDAFKLLKTSMAAISEDALSFFQPRIYRNDNHFRGIRIDNDQSQKFKIFIENAESSLVLLLCKFTITISAEYSPKIFKPRSFWEIFYPEQSPEQFFFLKSAPKNSIVWEKFFFKRDLGQTLLLQSYPSSSSSILKFPEKLINPEGAYFELEIFPNDLEHGKFHYFEITGLIADYPDIGPVFRLPIFICIPDKVNDNSNFKRKIELEAEVPYRLFVQPPPESCQCLLTLEYLGEESEALVKVFSNTATIFKEADIVKLNFSSTIRKRVHLLELDPKKSKMFQIALLKDLPGHFDVELQFYSSKTLPPVSADLKPTKVEIPMKPVTRKIIPNELNKNVYTGILGYELHVKDTTSKYSFQLVYEFYALLWYNKIMSKHICIDLLPQTLLPRRLNYADDEREIHHIFEPGAYYIEVYLSVKDKDILKRMINNNEVKLAVHQIFENPI